MDEASAAQLKNKVDEIREHLVKAKADGWKLNEADTEHKVIDPLLTALGYGPFDIHKRGHDSVANNFPDYTLLPGTTHKWFLEVKKLDLPLQDGEAAQAVNYANNQGAEWAVLTNGRKWYIYNAHLLKPLTEKRVFQVDDLFADEGALKTLAFLSRSSMLAGGLMQAWTFAQVQGIVKAQLETPNSAVRRQLRKMAADETNTPVSDALIEQALRFLSPAPPAAFTDNGDGPAPSPQKPQPPIDMDVPQYTFAQIGADGSLGTGKKPMCLHFSDNTSAEVSSWADAGISALTRAAEQFGLPQMPFNNRTKGKTYFLNTQPMHGASQPMKSYRTAHVSGTAIYMDTNRSARDLAGSVLAVLKAIGSPADFVKVSIR